MHPAAFEIVPQSVTILYSHQMQSFIGSSTLRELVLGLDAEVLTAESTEWYLSLRLEELISQRALVLFRFFSLYIFAVVLSSSKIIVFISSLSARNFRTYYYFGIHLVQNKDFQRNKLT